MIPKVKNIRQSRLPGKLTQIQKKENVTEIVQLRNYIQANL